MSPKEDVRMRKKLCKFIFHSNYFEYKDEKPVNVNSIRIQNELKINYPDTFSSLYTESRALSHLPIRRHYDNPYKLRAVFVPRRAILPKEYVFMCPIRELGSNTIKEYYVSAKYNVNGANHTNATNITGRFLFLRDTKSNYLVVHALAEEPAQTVLTFDIDLMYFLRRGYNLPSEIVVQYLRYNHADQPRLSFSSLVGQTAVLFMVFVGTMYILLPKSTETKFLDHFLGFRMRPWPA